MVELHNTKQQRLLGIKNKITFAFILFLIIPIISIAIISLSNMNGLGNDVANISGNAIASEQYRSMDEITNSKRDYIDEVFTKKGNDVKSFVQYAEDLFNGRINVTNIDSDYHTNSSEVDNYFPNNDYGGAWVSLDTSMYYFPDDSNYSSHYEIEELSPSIAKNVNLSRHFDVMFKQMKSTTPEYAWIYMGFEEEGMFRCFPFTEWENKSYDPRVRGWYNDSKNTGELIYTEAYEDSNDLGLMISVAAPVYYDNGSLIGVIAVDLTIPTLQESVLNTQILDSGYAFLIDENGNSITHPDLNLVKKEVNIPIDSNSLEGSGFSSTLFQMASTNSGNATYSKNGSNWYVIYKTIPSTNYKFAIVVPEDEIVAPATTIKDKILALTSQQLITLILILVGAITLVIITSSVVSKKIIDPITNLTKMMNFISQGSISREIPMEAKSSKDEIEILTASFQNLLTMLRLGNTDYYRGNLDLAAKNYAKAFEIFKLSDNLKGMGICANNLGNIYRIRGDFKSAEESYKLSIELAKKIDDQQPLPKRLSNLAQLYADSDQNEFAIEYFEKAVNICNSLGFKTELAQVFRNFGLFKAKNNNLDDGKALIQLALESDSKNKAKLGIAYDQFYLGKIAVMENDENALSILQDAVKSSVKLNDTRLKMNLYKELELLYERTQKRPQAHDMRINYEKLKTSLMQKKLVILTIDVSGSMTGNRISAAVNGALEIFDNKINPQDEVAIILFNSISEVILPPTQKGGNEEYIRNIIQRIKATRYQTALYDAIGDSFNLINQRISDEHKWNIILSDGMDNQSLKFNLWDRKYKGFLKFLNPDKRMGLGEFIEENLMTMNLIIIGLGKELIPIENDLKIICDKSIQGRYIPVHNLYNTREAINNAFLEVSDLLAQINVEEFID